MTNHAFNQKKRIQNALCDDAFGKEAVCPDVLSQRV
jgi:hypothetical protein